MKILYNLIYMNKKEVAKKVGKYGVKESVKFAAKKNPGTTIALNVAEKVKGRVDQEISNQELENLKALSRNNCKNIQMIIEYLQTKDSNVLEELSEKFSGFGVDSEGNQVVQQCNLDDINYKEYINNKVNTVKNALGINETGEEKPDLKVVNPLLLDDNDSTINENKVYYNPAMEVGAKKLKKKTKRKTRKKKTKRRIKKKSIKK